MHFRLLGPLEVVEDGRPVAVGGGKRRSLLTVLLLHANEVVSSDRLIDELWGEQPPATASKSLQVYVSQLRKELRSSGASPNGGPLDTRGHGYVLHVEQDGLDVKRFERLLAEAQQALDRGDSQRAAARARQALELWRGPPLAEFAYEPFAQQEIARLEELRLAALETRIDAELALGEHRRLVGELETLVREHPLRERLRAQLMLALYRSGRQAEALAAYREARKLLRDELGLEPTPELRELEQQILTQSSELAAPAVAPRPSRRREPPAAKESRRGPVLIVAGALLLAAATALALVQRLGDDGGSVNGGPALDTAANSLVGVEASGGRVTLAVPLPGRATDISATGGTVWAVTVNSRTLTGVDTRRGRILRSVPLRMTPDAIGVGAGSVWVADGRRGVLLRFEPGYDTVRERIRFPRSREVASPPGGRVRSPRAGIAVGAGAVWVTNGSNRLIRIDPRTSRQTGIRVPYRLNGVAVGAGAVWGMASERAAVVRVDPRRGAVTEEVPIVGKQGVDTPLPLAIAAGAGAVWVLEGNTATVTEIDPVTRAVVSTIQIGVERVPAELAAAGDTAWVANSDGTLTRIARGSSSARSVRVSQSLGEVATEGRMIWTTTTAVDQQLAGGTR
jgi:DNA-binding SARP family transcriptional activator/streptogramin lyase